MRNKYQIRIIYQNETFEEKEACAYYLTQDSFNYKYYNDENILRYGVCFNLLERINKIEVYENGIGLITINFSKIIKS